MLENEAEQILDIYHHSADYFASARGAQLREIPYMEQILTEIQDPRHVLDLGCGTGNPIAKYFQDSGCHVTGVDGASAMIGLFRQTLPGARAIVADMRNLALPQKFNAILAWNSFFHLTRDDQRAMFPVFARHARPGAFLTFTSGPADGIAMGEMQGRPLFHASLAPEEYRRLLAENGFETLSFTPEDPDCYGLSVWMAQKLTDTPKG